MIRLEAFLTADKQQKIHHYVQECGFSDLRIFFDKEKPRILQFVVKNNIHKKQHFVTLLEVQLMKELGCQVQVLVESKLKSLYKNFVLENCATLENISLIEGLFNKSIADISFIEVPKNEEYNAYFAEVTSSFIPSDNLNNNNENTIDNIGVARTNHVQGTFPDLPSNSSITNEHASFIKELLAPDNREITKNTLMSLSPEIFNEIKSVFENHKKEPPMKKTDIDYLNQFLFISSLTPEDEIKRIDEELNLLLQIESSVTTIDEDMLILRYTLNLLVHAFNQKNIAKQLAYFDSIEQYYQNVMQAKGLSILFKAKLNAAIGHCYGITQYYNDAIDCYKNALAFMQNESSYEDKDIETYYTNLIELNLKQDEYVEKTGPAPGITQVCCKEAIFYAKEALEFSPNNYLKTKYNYLLMQAYISLAVSENYCKNPLKALQLLCSALEANFAGLRLTRVQNNKDRFNNKRDLCYKIIQKILKNNDLDHTEAVYEVDNKKLLFGDLKTKISLTELIETIEKVITPSPLSVSNTSMFSKTKHDANILEQENEVPRPDTRQDAYIYSSHLNPAL